MTLPMVPHAALLNLRRLADLGAVGRYGHCEAIDFTRARLPLRKTHAVIRSWMAHHQGMVLLACDQALNRAPMQRRFLADPRLQAHRLLLQERPVAPAAHADDAGPDSQERPTHAPTLRVVTDPCGAVPEIHLLSNGRYHVLVSAAGGGVSRWQDLALTRWREDPTRDQWGPCCYLRDLRSGALWATTYQPFGQGGEHYEAIFTQAKVEFRRTDHGITVHTEIIVSPEDDMELRRVTLTNRSETPRTIEVTTYAEPVLAPAAADLAHPAFSNLFIETELLDGALLASRRPRAANEPRRWLVHQLLDRSSTVAGPLSCETERVRFLGRGRTTADARVFNGPAGPLSGSLGAVLDAVLALRRTVTIAAGGRAVLDIVYAVAESRTAATALAERYRDVHLAERARSLAVTHGQVVLAQLGVSEAEVQAFARIAGSLVYASSHRRAAATAIMRNRRPRSGLWSSGISGDLPICLLRISDGQRLELVRDLVQAHAWWRSHGLAVDLVVLIEDPSVYRQELSERVMAMVSANDTASLLDRPAGVFVRRVDQLPEEDRHLLTAYARVVISDAGGTLIQFAERRLRPAPMSAKLAVTAQRLETTPAHVPRHELLFNNGLGGFTRDGREYIITLPPQAVTPAPWCNVLANPGFGTVVSERGAAYTWAENCHEFRLTPWRCDAVSDPAGEALYLRDEESGVAWSPTIGPRRGSGTYVVRHGFGYSAFTSDEEAIACELHQWVDAVDPVKHYSLHLRNRSRRQRRISAWLYLEWTLGEIRERTGMHLVTAHEDGILLANNPLHDDFSGRHAFACASRRPTSWTCDRSEFLGRCGGPEDPAALQARGLLGRSGAGLDACAALHIIIELDPGQEQQVVFTLGAGSSRTQALTLARQHQGVSAAEASLAQVYEYWKEVLGRVQVQTSDPAFDVLVNGWLPYQVIAARIFARSGFSQSGGAFGFRDQLQDTMALVHHAPQLLREQLLRAASRQFTAGDVQHWWHPPQGRGVRTRISDDFLWLPYALARYLMATGDRGILEVRVPFLQGPEVPEGQDSLYDLPQVSDEQGTLYEHAVRAILRGMRYGVHDLPLMGTGDWNDGMDRVGAHGKGESVWLGFFLAEVLQRFAPVAELTGDVELAKRLALEASALGKRLDAHAWDGDWYLRAWFDDGTPLGSKDAKECRIDALPQAWAALAGVSDAQRTRTALAAVDRELVRTVDGLIQLFDPPFGSDSQASGAEVGRHPGYIKGYVPGVRENGGQYTHAAVWTAMAHAALGDGQRALELARLINPIRHASDAAGCARWRGEPYVMAADVYRSPGHVGQAGWTWYTGSAGWMWRLLAESLLGVEILAGVRLRCRPTTPADFGDFTITYRHGEAVYNLTVTGAGAVRRVLLDGRLQADDSLPLERSAGTHAVRIEREMNVE
jgi:cellobiose phosphorylase